MQKPVAFAAVFLYLPYTQVLRKLVEGWREISS